MAAAISVTQVKTRLRALLAAYGPTWTDFTTGIAIATLPAYTVEAREATREGNKSRRLVTRQYALFVYVTEILRVDDYEEMATAKANCDPLIDPLADYLSARPRLELDVGGEGLVYGCGEVSDTGAAAPTPYRGKNYSAFLLEIPVITVR